MSLITSQITMCGPHFCSMKITEDVRKYAAEHSIDENVAIEYGLGEKAASFNMVTQKSILDRIKLDSSVSPSFHVSESRKWQQKKHTG